MIVDPIKAVSSIFRTVVERYETHFGELFVIVGETTSLEITLYISSSGDFYGGYDDSISKLGNNFHEALDTLINGDLSFLL